MSSNSQVIKGGLAASNCFGSAGPYKESGHFSLNDHYGYKVACQIVSDYCEGGKLPGQSQAIC